MPYPHNECVVSVLCLADISSLSKVSRRDKSSNFQRMRVKLQIYKGVVLLLLDLRETC
jgi:hypothetical protein